MTGQSEPECEPAPLPLHLQQCARVVETYDTIADGLTARGRTVPPEVIATLAGIALRLLLVRP
jgi:hypothetical protein